MIHCCFNFFFAFICSVVFSQETVDLASLLKNPDRFTGRVIRVEGFCERWLQSLAPDVNYYLLRDKSGASARVRSFRRFPAPGETLQLICLVIWEPQQNSFYLKERERTGSKEKAEIHLAWLIFLTATGFILILMGILILWKQRQLPSIEKGKLASVFRKIEDSTRKSLTIPKLIHLINSNSEDRKGWDSCKKVERKPPLEITHKPLPGRLILLDVNEKHQKEIPLYQVSRNTQFTIGREVGNPLKHIQIAHDTISREQAVIWYENGKFWLKNRSRTNPTIVDGVILQKNQSRELSDQSRIVMGDVVLRFERTEENEVWKLS